MPGQGVDDRGRARRRRAARRRPPTAAFDHLGLATPLDLGLDDLGGGQHIVVGVAPTGTLRRPDRRLRR